MTNEFSSSPIREATTSVTPQGDFPGLKEGDRWCLCVTRWHEALEAGAARPVDLPCCTDASTLEFVTLEELQAHTLTRGLAGGRLPRRGKQDSAQGLNPGRSFRTMRAESGASLAVARLPVTSQPRVQTLG